MPRNLLLFCSAMLGLTMTCSTAAWSADEPDRLNILLFTADDLHAESLGAFEHRNDRSLVDQALLKTYGPPKQPAKRNKKKQKK